ncbi:MAG: PPC domain-containing DNA-binding protein [Candidatus Latescibacterota bacterium]
MNYSVGRPGRIIVARFDHGEEIVSGMKKLVRESGVTSGAIFFLGALRSGETVAGPREDTLPPIPHWLSFDRTHEVAGVGTVFPAEGEPVIHMHGALGRGDRSLLVCLRRMAEVYLILEVIILEILDTPAIRVKDPNSDIRLLKPEGGDA